MHLVNLAALSVVASCCLCPCWPKPEPDYFRGYEAAQLEREQAEIRRAQEGCRRQQQQDLADLGSKLAEYRLFAESAGDDRLRRIRRESGYSYAHVYISEFVPGGFKNYDGDTFYWDGVVPPRGQRIDIVGRHAGIEIDCSNAGHRPGRNPSRPRNRFVVYAVLSDAEARQVRHSAWDRSY